MNFGERGEKKIAERNEVKRAPTVGREWKGYLESHVSGVKRSEGDFLGNSFIQRNCYFWGSDVYCR